MAGKKEIDARFQRILDLLTLQKQSRHKTSLSELAFFMVNQTFNLLPYRHCIYWCAEHGKVTLEEGSGQVHLDKNGPYALWLRKTIQKVVNAASATGDDGQQTKTKDNYATVVPLSIDDIKKSDVEQWKKWASQHAFLILFHNMQGEITGGLWIDRNEEFSAADKALIEDVADMYAYAHQGFVKSTRTGGGLFRLSGKIGFVKMLVFLLVVFVWPVRLSTTAPAEIVARSMEVVSVPFDGVIDEVLVRPNGVVKQGDLLVSLDKTALKSKSVLARQELRTAEAALSKTEREALRDPEKLVEINVLRAQIKSKELEKKHADELLGLSDIVAQEDGIALFDDANALVGRPVRAGEQVMLLAEPDESELLIRIPVEGMIELDRNVPVKFFLNIKPLGEVKAMIHTVGYQSTRDTDDLLTYKVRAKFKDNKHLMRIGLAGTAKVYGDWTILGFNIFRRPLIAFRKMVGI